MYILKHMGCIRSVDVAVRRTPFAPLLPARFERFGNDASDPYTLPFVDPSCTEATEIHKSWSEARREGMGRLVKVAARAGHSRLV